MLFFAAAFFVIIGVTTGQRTDSCSVDQECVSIKDCSCTQELFSQVKATTNPSEKAKLIQAIRVRVCGEPSDRTVCCDIERANSDFPRIVGYISRNTFHALSGELWALDEHTLEFRKFIYDGEGPDAFFIVGDESAGNEPNLGDAIPLPFSKNNPPIRKRYFVEDAAIPVLPEFKGETFQLELPPCVKVSNLKWMSLFCRDFNIDFGNVMFQ